MGKYFGTDGIRGIPWKFPFTPDFLRKIGYASAYILKKHLKHDNSKNVYIGMDSRQSGEKIKKYISQGIISNGFKIIDIGIVTTPCLAYMVKEENGAFGVMISASHNSPEFNGIKIFSNKGKKIDDIIEDKIEKFIDKSIDFPPSKINSNNYRTKKNNDKYIKFILNTLPKNFNFKGTKICLDCANGGGYKIAPEIFRRLGAKLVVIGNKPNGKNINKGYGALNTDKMIKTTLMSKSICGISLDGDGDRCILCDRNGIIFDGDDIIAFLSVFLKEKGDLNKSTVVLTIMSNYGLIKYLNSMGIKAIQVQVGDKNVTDALDRHNLSLGGENSGHIIIRKFSPTGDGILSSLWTLYAAYAWGKKLEYLKNLWSRYPQILKSIKVDKKIKLSAIKGFEKKIKDLERQIEGRIFLRYSGTEPVLRILVEGKNQIQVKEAAEVITDLYLAGIRKYNCQVNSKISVGKFLS